jgi:hypothetical protein
MNASNGRRLNLVPQAGQAGYGPMNRASSGRRTADGSAPSSTTRDLRIDFFRGLALWMIFADHISGNFWRGFTYRNLGLSDAAEIFIFLSGLACAIAYGGVLRRDGWAAAEARTLRRALRIYAGYVAASAAFFAIALASTPLLPADGITILDLPPLLRDPRGAALAALDFRFTPYTLMVLPVYIVLVPLAVPVLVALRRRPLPILAASLALWLATQAVPSFNLPSLLEGGVWPMNPFAWQLLFVIGLVVGWRFYHSGDVFVASRRLFWIAAVAVASGFGFRVLHAASFHLGWHAPVLGDLYDAALGDTAKTNLQALRLLHFLAVAYLVAAFVAPREAAFAGAWARPLVVCGQHSLEVFCISVVLNLLASVWMMVAAPPKLLQLALTLVGCLTLWLSALLFARRRRRTPMPTSISPA